MTLTSPGKASHDDNSCHLKAAPRAANTQNGGSLPFQITSAMEYTISSLYKTSAYSLLPTPKKRAKPFK